MVMTGGWCKWHCFNHMNVFFMGCIRWDKMRQLAVTWDIGMLGCRKICIVPRIADGNDVVMIFEKQTTADSTQAHLACRAASGGGTVTLARLCRSPSLMGGNPQLQQPV